MAVAQVGREAVQALRLAGSEPRPDRVAFLMAVAEMAAKGEYGRIDAIFRAADPPRMTGLCMTTVLCGTYRFRHLLPTWPDLHARCARELGSRGETRGLPDPDPDCDWSPSP